MSRLLTPRSQLSASTTSRTWGSICGFRPLPAGLSGKRRQPLCQQLHMAALFPARISRSSPGAIRPKSHTCSFELHTCISRCPPACRAERHPSAQATAAGMRPGAVHGVGWRGDAGRDRAARGPARPGRAAVAPLGCPARPRRPGAARRQCRPRGRQPPAGSGGGRGRPDSIMSARGDLPSGAAGDEDTAPATAAPWEAGVVEADGKPLPTAPPPGPVPVDGIPQPAVAPRRVRRRRRLEANPAPAKRSGRCRTSRWRPAAGRRPRARPTGSTSGRSSSATPRRTGCPPTW